jgi:hypothetical protein
MAEHTGTGPGWTIGVPLSLVSTALRTPPRRLVCQLDGFRGHIVAGRNAYWILSLVPKVYQNTVAVEPSRGLLGELLIIIVPMAFHGSPGRRSERCVFPTVSVASRLMTRLKTGLASPYMPSKMLDQIIQLTPNPVPRYFRGKKALQWKLGGNYLGTVVQARDSLPGQELNNYH